MAAPSLCGAKHMSAVTAVHDDVGHIADPKLVVGVVLASPKLKPLIVTE